VHILDIKVSKSVDSRKGPDLILRMIDIISVILWGFIIVNFAIILFAKPVGETFFDRFFSIKVRDYWDASLLQFSLILSLAQLFLSVFSLFLNSKRLKRKDDRLRISIIASIFISLFICVYLTMFLFL
jgi:hypothetical protein